MSQSTTWTYDLQDNMSQPLQKIRSVISDVMAATKRGTEGVTQSQKVLSSTMKKLQSYMDIAKAKMANAFSPKAIKEATLEVERLQAEIQQLNNTPTKSPVDGMKKTIGGIGGMIGGVFVADLATNFTKGIVEATAANEKYHASLTNAFNSTAMAKGAENMLAKFGKQTTDSNNEITESYIKMVNRGFVPTMNEMTKLGDLAASQGKPFDQLTEAILDAQTGEFERLKGFGIEAEKHGNTVSLSFKGINKEVANTPAAIQEALLAYGDMDGVAGSMAVQMDTISGKTSTMGKLWSEFKGKLGEAGAPALKDIFDKINNIIATLIKHTPLIIDIISSIATGVKVTAIVFGVLGAVTTVAAIAIMGFSGVMGVLNAVIAANPIMAVVVGITLAVAAIMLAWKRCEGFRTFVYGLWGTIKSVFTAMWDVVKNFFGGLAKMIGAILGGDWEGFKEGAKQFGKGLAGVNPIGFATMYSQDIMTAAKTESLKGKNKPKEEEEAAADPSLPPTSPTGGKPLGKINTSDTSSTGSSGTSGTGSNMRSVITEIKQLVGTININSTTAQEGTTKMKALITEALVSAVRDAEIALAQ